jgi:hypothetical protein
MNKSTSSSASDPMGKVKAWVSCTKKVVGGRGYEKGSFFTSSLKEWPPKVPEIPTLRPQVYKAPKHPFKVDMWLKMPVEGYANPTDVIGEQE